MQNLSICNTAIRQFDGLYSLNDLHKAAGSDKKHQPALFVRLDQTKALISEIECSTDMQIKAVSSLRGVRKDGLPQGTYACRELVVAYAAWISATFHLKVIRTFLTTVEQPPTQGDSYLPQIMARASNTACSIAGHIAGEMAKQVHNLHFAHRFLVVVDDNNITIRDIAGMNLVNIEHVRKVKRDTRTVTKALQELVRRTGILEGDLSPSDLDLPLVCSI